MVAIMNIDKCKQIDSCIACGGSNILEVLDLKTQPLANSFKNSKSEQQEEYPLKLNKCQDCHHLQLSHMVHPDELFKNYLYVSGTSKTQLNYFEWFAKMVSDKIANKQGNILDIGCNDGSQLNYFKSLGFKTYGIDPAENLHKISSQNHNVICDYFNTTNTHDGVEYDAIICQNAFAHNFNQLEFLKKCKTILNDNGLILITISQADMVKNNEFDTIYHEHYSYYNVNSMKTICERAGLHLTDVIQHPIHGNSYIFVISKNGSEQSLFKINKLIEEENNIGLYDAKKYTEYSKNANSIAIQFKEKLEELKQEGYILIGYGSPAKGNTMLNFSKGILDFIIDDNPLKQNLFTPGSSIQIHSIDHLDTVKDNNKICFVPLAWNFFDEIKNKISNKRPNKTDLYLKYFPEVNLIKSI
jgi:SAM-dependent methyltransferase